jgi:hypothetical protein
LFKEKAAKTVQLLSSRVVILHVNREFAVAKVDELRLVRASDSSNQWQFAPGEMQRTKQAAGL